MTDVLARFNSGKLWEFKGGIHPPEMKSQSNQTPISTALLVDKYYIPVKQHSGNAGNILVKIGDSVLKGQPLTQGGNLRDLPVHSPTSGVITNILPYVAAHPSGLAELSIEITADYRDQWCERHPIEDFLTQTPEQLIEKIYAAGVAGLGGAVFPTAAKIQSADKQVKLLIINGAECEPYISCDDRLMQDYAAEIIEGTRILRYILRPEKVVIAVEDNKPKAIEALQQALQGANDIEIRVIPTKYPSGAARQLIQILTGMEVPSGQRSSSIGVLMQNVGTVFAIKRAVINDEPLIERVITLTGDKIPLKGNQWVRLGTPIIQLLQQVEYQYDSRFPVFMGGPMMGFILPNLNAPVTKLTNCLLAPDHFEYAPPMTEQSCIRCSACSDACPVNLMPQQLYWFSRSEDHEKAQQYAIKDCIECGICAYVCPSHIPLIQYFRQEKAKIWELQEKAKKSEEAKIRFEARQARLEKEELERKARSLRAAENRREELAKQQGVDPVQAALERLKAKKSETQDSVQIKEIKTKVDEKGKILPDNTDIMAQRQARRAAKQAQLPNKSNSIINQNITEHATEHITEASAVDFNPEKDNQKPTALDDKKSAVAAAIARAKAKKAAQQQGSEQVVNQLTAENMPHVDNNHEAAASPADSVNENVDAKKAAVAAAIARAKAKKAAQQQGSEPVVNQLTAENMPHVDNNHEVAASPADSVNENVDAKKAAVAAAIARAKAKKAAQQQGNQQAE